MCYPPVFSVGHPARWSPDFWISGFGISAVSFQRFHHQAEKVPQKGVFLFFHSRFEAHLENQYQQLPTTMLSCWGDDDGDEDDYDDVGGN